MHPVFRRYSPLWALAACVLLALLWGALAPLRYPSHERLFEIPPDALGAGRQPAARRVALPRVLTLTLGVQDVLLLRNRDRVGHVFGPLQLRPGQDFRLPFEQPGNYVYACPAVAGGELLVRVVRSPDPGWERLRWRVAGLVQSLRHLPLVAPQD
ncbi:hypothetical protein QPK31_24400 [Massilia sp. YIM B02769]|jgi:hypothetical protein|uniref:cupredoxin domain-containing protein n=1 Tax=unclassified Massilia TaxID=2609279 RepID=UPI0025B6B0AD|nr:MULTISPECIES: hypothetical protein [unclassified Massilia]MDN4061366.1 hypothetical protein [Massilia sp. YIM B02769]